MKGTRRESIHTLIYMLSQLLVKGSTFFLAPLYTRIMSQAEYGTVSVFTSMVSILAIFTGLQVSSSINNSKIDFPDEQQAEYRSSVLIISCLSFAVMMAVFLPLRNPIGGLFGISGNMIPVGLVAAFGSSCLTFQNVQSIADQKPQWYMAASMAAILLDITLSVLLISSMQEKAKARILAITLVYAIIAIWVVTSTLLRGRKIYSARYWRYCLPLVLPLILQVGANQIFAQCDVLMLNRIVGKDTAGLYSFSHTMGQPLSAVWTAYNATWVPMFYRLMKVGDISGIQRAAKNYGRIFSMLTYGFILVCPEIFKLLAAEEYQAGERLVPVFALFSYCSFLDSLSINYEFYHRKTFLLSISTLTAAGVNVLLNYLMIPQFGIYGAVSATLISQTGIILLHERGAKKLGGCPVSVTMVSKEIFVVILIAVVSITLFEYWMIRWVLAAIVGIALLRRLLKTHSLF